MKSNCVHCYIDVVRLLLLVLLLLLGLLGRSLKSPRFSRRLLRKG
jgi:hypothetical protein